MAHAKQSSEPLLLKETLNRVLWLTLNRPAQRNPLSAAMLQELKKAIQLANDDTQVRAIVISSTGPVFCAGHDLKEMGRWEGEALADQQTRMRSILQHCSELMLSIVHSPKAIIACVQGAATAAGCQLVSACDLAIASETSTFCTPGVNIGGFCTTPLVGIGRTVHRKHAMAMALTGDALPAEEAVRIGLVNQAVPEEHVNSVTKVLAERIASKSAEGIRQGKADFYSQIEMPLAQAFSFANEAMVRAMTTPDSEEGSAAFFEKRKPNWREI